ncbi:MAG: GntR family transcriptional regulator [Carbonactinosporaceae bacterium]
MRDASVAPQWKAPPLGRVAAPLREQACEALRQAIISLELPPGYRLVERELIQRLGVSRTTVREALRELESEGLVTVIPQRGAVVATLSAREAADLYEARVAIEALVVRRFVERASDSAIAELRTAAEAFATLSERGGDISHMLAAKDQFYDVLVRGAGSPPLQQLLGSLQARVRQLRATSLSQDGRPKRAAEELRDLVDAIAARDVAAAERLCSAHVRTAASTGLEALRSPDS